MKDEEIKKKAELNLDDLDDRGFDFDEWSITDAYVNGAIFSAEIVTKELEKENEQLKNDYEMIHNCFLITENEKKELEKQIEKMKELLNRYYEVCVQIPKKYRTMVFDSCLEDTRKLNSLKE